MDIVQLFACQSCAYWWPSLFCYEGSLDEWAAVVKGGNWDGRGGQVDGTLKKVICLDGYMQYDTETKEWTEVRE